MNTCDNDLLKFSPNANANIVYQPSENDVCEDFSEEHISSDAHQPAQTLGNSRELEKDFIVSVIHSMPEIENLDLREQSTNETFETKNDSRCELSTCKIEQRYVENGNISTENSDPKNEFGFSSVDLDHEATEEQMNAYLTDLKPETSNQCDSAVMETENNQIQKSFQTSIDASVDDEQTKSDIDVTNKSDAICNSDMASTNTIGIEPYEVAAPVSEGTDHSFALRNQLTTICMVYLSI